MRSLIHRMILKRRWKESKDNQELKGKETCYIQFFYFLDEGEYILNTFLYSLSL